MSKDGKEMEKYNSCNTIYVISGTYLNCHVMRRDKIKTEDVDQMILDIQRKLKGKKYRSSYTS